MNAEMQTTKFCGALEIFFLVLFLYFAFGIRKNKFFPELGSCMSHLSRMRKNNEEVPTKINDFFY